MVIKTKVKIIPTIFNTDILEEEINKAIHDIEDSGGSIKDIKITYNCPILIIYKQ